MKSKIIALLYFISLSFLFSCRPLAKVVYGLHKPRLESTHSVLKYAKSRDINHVTILVPKDTSSFLELFNLFRTTPDLYLFDSLGNSLLYSDKSDCNAPVSVVIDSICNGVYKFNAKGKELAQIFNCLKPLEKKDSLNFLEAQKMQVKYTGFITWNKYTGYLNKNHVKPWVKGFGESKDCAWNSFLINMDFLDNIWTKEDVKGLKFKLD